MSVSDYLTILKFLFPLEAVLCLGQDFWETLVSPYLNFKGTLANSWGHTEITLLIGIQFRVIISGSFCSFLHHFELDVDGLGSRKGCR